MIPFKLGGWGGTLYFTMNRMHIKSKSFKNELKWLGEKKSTFPLNSAISPELVIIIKA